MTGTAAEVLARCAELGELSEEPDRLTRRFATPAHGQAGELLVGWMAHAGMTTRRDAIGNVIGRYGAGDRPVVLGSHFDTVPDAGSFDGPLGILAAIAVVERLAAGGAQPSSPVEVAAFADEEGMRFGTAFLGSAAYAGLFEPAWLELVDRDGITLEDAVRAAGGEDPRAASRVATPELAAYLELHIEQGPVLEREDLPVGVVSAIVGHTRANVAVRGEAGHAGTLPMDGRRDALAAAADIVLAVERLGRETDGLVATVGRVGVEPGAANVVPGSARLPLDVRHPADDVRESALATLRRALEDVATKRTVEVDLSIAWERSAVELSPDLRGDLARAIAAEGHPVRELASGAGHDAAVLSRICPAAMLFVRCAGGISHDPREAVDEDDVAVALDVLEGVVRAM